MAKEKKEKEEVKAEEPESSVEDAFSEEAEDETQAQKEETGVEKETASQAEAVADAEIDAQKKKEEADKVEEEAPAKTTEEAVAEKEPSEETPKTKTWAELGHPRFDSMSREQIAATVEFERKLSGVKDDRLNEARRALEERDRQIAEFTKQKPAEQPEVKAEDVLGSLPPMTEEEQFAFQEQFSENPRKAIADLVAPHIKKIIEQQFTTSLPERVKGTVEEHLKVRQEQAEFATFLDRHKDEGVEKFIPAMKDLDKPENLGETARTYDDLLELAKIGTLQEDGKPHHPSYPPIFQMMKTYPNMSFAEAKKFVALQETSPDSAISVREGIKSTVKELQAVGSTTPKKSKTVTEAVVSVDAAFEENQDET